MSIQLNNYSTVDGIQIDTGAMKFTSAGGIGGTDNGFTSVAALATLEVATGANRTYGAGASITGSGTVKLTAGNAVVYVNAAVTASVGLFEIDAGQLRGTGSLSVSGTLKWLDGEISVAQLSSGSRMEITEGTKKLGPGPGTATTTLSLAGVTTWGGGFGIIELNNATINNTSTFEHWSDGWVSPPVGVGGLTNGFNNLTGGVVKQMGGEFTTFRVPFTNAGTVLVRGYTMNFFSGLQQTAGVFDLGGGVADLTDLAGVHVFLLTGGSLTGGGTLTGHLTQNGGSIVIGPTLGLTVNGNYTQTAGSLVIQASAPNLWGKLTVNGNTSLGGTSGTLGILLLDDYNPAPGFSKEIIKVNNGTLSGAFVEPTPGWDVAYDYDTKNVTVTRQ